MPTLSCHFYPKTGGWPINTKRLSRAAGHPVNKSTAVTLAALRNEVLLQPGCIQVPPYHHPQSCPNGFPWLSRGLDCDPPCLEVAVAITLQNQLFLEREIGPRSQLQRDLGSRLGLPRSTDASFLQLKSHLREMSSGSCPGELSSENFSSSELKASKNKQFTKVLQLLGERWGPILLQTLQEAHPQGRHWDAFFPSMPACCRAPLGPPPRCCPQDVNMS